MSESCNSQCSTCSKECGERKEKNSFLVDTNEKTHVKKIIGIVSGKGGVGKSFVSSLLASRMNQRNHSVAVLDGDITGPSIPKAFGLDNRYARGTEEEIFPVESEKGVKVMSLNFLVENTTDPVIWRGPNISGLVKQFWSGVTWGDVDYMFVDMPPGTGDVPLTVFQSIPLDGIIIVTSPQKLVSMIVAKAVHMAQGMNIPIIGIVENMSYLECPDCGKKISVFGESRIEETAAEYKIDTFARIPIDSSIAEACDEGKIEEFQSTWLDEILNRIESL